MTTYKALKDFGDFKAEEVVDVTSWTAEHISEAVSEGELEVVEETVSGTVNSEEQVQEKTEGEEANA